MSEGDAYVVGSSEYSATLNGYTFYFSSPENKALFEASPWKYSPSWGGFCAWGMAEEREPSYNWEPSNLGPSVDLTLWLVRNDRLFLFYKSEAMEKFLVDPDQFELDGDERWVAWYGAKEQSPFNTDCYVQLEIEGETATSDKVQGVGEGKEEVAGSESKGSAKVEEGKEEGGDQGKEMGGGEAVGTQKGKEEGTISKESTPKQEGGEKEVQSGKTEKKGGDKQVQSEKTEEGGEKEAKTEKTEGGEKKDSEKADAKQETGSSKSEEEGKEEGGKTVSSSKKSTHKALKGKSTHKAVKGSSEKAVKGGKSKKEAGK
jgi:YHS domain-containing protein